MRRLTPISALLALLALAASLLGGAAAGAQPAAPTYRVMLPLLVQAGAPAGRPAPDPVTIAVAPDAPLAVSAEVGPEGGSLGAAAADGTTFQLVIPPGSLEYTETLRLTPARASGLPFAAGSLGAVLVEPAGLTLLAPATLTISPAAGAGAPLSAFAFEPGGGELHLHPAAPAPAGLAAAAGLTLRPQTLRGYGATSATAGELDAQARRGPTRFVDWLEQEVARSGGQKVSVPEEVLRQYIEAELVPAAKDPALAERAIADYVRVDELLLRHGTDETIEFMLVETLRFLLIVDGAVTAAHQRCVAQQRASEGLRIARIIRYYLAFSPGANVSSWQDRLSRCLTFEVTFRSRITEESAQMTRSATAESSVTLTAEGTTARLTGGAPSRISATSWTGEQPPCPATISRGESDFLARGFQLGLRLAPGGAEFSYSPGVNLSATYTFRCPTPAGPRDIPMLLPWSAYYDELHRDRRVSGELLFYRIASRGIDIDRFTGWVYHDSQDLGEVTITEDTQIEIAHRPRP